MKIEKNKVICKCGENLGEWEEGKMFFCKKCLKVGFSPKTYGVSISLEDVFGKINPTYEKCATCEFSDICHKADNHYCILYKKSKKRHKKAIKIMIKGSE